MTNPYINEIRSMLVSKKNLISSILVQKVVIKHIPTAKCKIFLWQKRDIRNTGRKTGSPGSQKRSRKERRETYGNTADGREENNAGRKAKKKRERSRKLRQQNNKNAGISHLAEDRLRDRLPGSRSSPRQSGNKPSRIPCPAFKQPRSCSRAGDAVF